MLKNPEKVLRALSEYQRASFAVWMELDKLQMRFIIGLLILTAAYALTEVFALPSIIPFAVYVGYYMATCQTKKWKLRAQCDKGEAELVCLLFDELRPKK